MRECLRKLGIQLDVMDTVSVLILLVFMHTKVKSFQRNACSAYNLLTEEGRRVAAALLPLSSRPWQKNT